MKADSPPPEKPAARPVVGAFVVICSGLIAAGLLLFLFQATRGGLERTSIEELRGTDVEWVAVGSDPADRVRDTESIDRYLGILRRARAKGRNREPVRGEYDVVIRTKAGTEYEQRLILCATPMPLAFVEGSFHGYTLRAPELVAWFDEAFGAAER